MVYSESWTKGGFKHIWVLGVGCPPQKVVEGQTLTGQGFLLLWAKLGQGSTGWAPITTGAFCLSFGASAPETQQVTDKSVESAGNQPPTLGGGAGCTLFTRVGEGFHCTGLATAHCPALKTGDGSVRSVS